MSNRFRLSGLLILFAGLSLPNSPALGCLRETVDARAIQWSQVIVKATFSAVSPPKNLSSDGWQYRIYTFQVNEVLDGNANVNDSVEVVRFIGPQFTRSGPCAQSLTDQQIGQSCILLLRHEQDLSWSANPKIADARSPELHGLHAFIFVSILSGDDLSADLVEDLKHQITDVRAADAQFSPTDAQAQANAVARAADATEEQDAEHALLEMGFKAMDVIQSAIPQAPPAGQVLLRRLVEAVSPPPIVDENSPATRP